MVGVEQQFLETSRVAHDVFGYDLQRAVPFVDVLDLSVAALEDWDALEHDEAASVPRLKRESSGCGGGSGDGARSTTAPTRRLRAGCCGRLTDARNGRLTGAATGTGAAGGRASRQPRRR